MQRRSRSSYGTLSQHELIAEPTESTDIITANREQIYYVSQLINYLSKQGIHCHL